MAVGKIGGLLRIVYKRRLRNNYFLEGLTYMVYGPVRINTSTSALKVGIDYGRAMQLSEIHLLRVRESHPSQVKVWQNPSVLQDLVKTKAQAHRNLQSERVQVLHTKP